MASTYPLTEGKTRHVEKGLKNNKKPIKPPPSPKSSFNNLQKKCSVCGAKTKMTHKFETDCFGKNVKFESNCSKCRAYHMTRIRYDNISDLDDLEVLKEHKYQG